MLTVVERFMIKQMHQGGVSISEIARESGHDRKTIRRRCLLERAGLDAVQTLRLRRRETFTGGDDAYDFFAA